VALGEVDWRESTGAGLVRLTAVKTSDLPLLEQYVRAYYLEDGHAFHEARQLPALAALAADESFGRAWLIGLGARPVGYVVLTWAFSVEAGGREACVDELYLVPELRNRGLASRVLALHEAEARGLGVRRLFLEVERRNRAIGLYRRAGYVDHDRFLMSKLLDPLVGVAMMTRGWPRRRRPARTSTTPMDNRI
jgi:ribosomal protein S18 acetylase RimI-like enzyme